MTDNYKSSAGYLHQQLFFLIASFYVFTIFLKNLCYPVRDSLPNTVSLLFQSFVSVAYFSSIAQTITKLNLVFIGQKYVGNNTRSQVLDTLTDLYFFRL